MTRFDYDEINNVWINTEVVEQLHFPTEKSEELDETITEIFGIDRRHLIENNLCALCNQPNMEFRTGLDKREYEISGLCQDCQDDVFGEGSEESVSEDE